MTDKAEESGFSNWQDFLILILVLFSNLFSHAANSVVF